MTTTNSKASETGTKDGQAWAAKQDCCDLEHAWRTVATTARARSKRKAWLSDADGSAGTYRQAFIDAANRALGI